MFASSGAKIFQKMEKLQFSSSCSILFIMFLSFFIIFVSSGAKIL